MPSKSICYHTRHRSTGAKAAGGTFGFTTPGKYFDQETIERLLKNHAFKVEFTKSGSPTFVDKEGRQVHLYINVDPLFTSIGQEAQKAYLAERRKQVAQEEQQRVARERELEGLIAELGDEEALRRLKGG